MSSNDHRDRVIDEVVDRVMQRAAIDAEEDIVRDKAADAVDELMEAPLQTFTSVLAENAVLSDLHGTAGHAEEDDA